MPEGFFRRINLVPLDAISLHPLPFRLEVMIDVRSIIDKVSRIALTVAYLRRYDWKL